jgi:methionine-rich copper-binding protein CopC
MRKIVLFILFSLLLWGCEKKYDNVIDTSSGNYQVTSISHHASYDLKTPADSLLVVRINFSQESELSKAYFDIIASDNSVLNSSPVELLPLENNIFQNQFILKREFPNGTYNLNFRVTGLDGKSSFVASSSFQFNNGQDNVPPFISNSVIYPDTVVVNDTTVISTSITAIDSNGTNDIEEVYFIVYKPDGTSNNSHVILFDDGNLDEHGDSTAGDNVYSRLIQVNQSNDKGTYRFEFRAKDRSDSLSNIVNHLVLIQ